MIDCAVSTDVSSKMLTFTGESFANDSVRLNGVLLASLLVPADCIILILLSLSHTDRVRRQ